MPSLNQFIEAQTGRTGSARGAPRPQRGQRPAPACRAADLDDLGRAYRQVVSDLAIARRDFPDDQLTATLNALAARAHLRLYRAPSIHLAPPRGASSPPTSPGASPPPGVRRRRRRLALPPRALGFLAGLLDPTLRDALVPAAMRELMERGQTWTEIEGPLRPLMASVIFTNNIRIAFLAFAGGVLAGLGTAYVLVFNGLFLGAVFGAAALLRRRQPAGRLRLPPRLSRADVHRRSPAPPACVWATACCGPACCAGATPWPGAGASAVELLLGTTPVLVLAGLVEGFVSPSGLPTPYKVAIGPLLWLVWAALDRLVAQARSPGSRARPASS